MGSANFSREGDGGEGGGAGSVMERRATSRIHGREPGRRDLRGVVVVGRQWLRRNGWSGSPCGCRHARMQPGEVGGGKLAPLFLCGARGSTARRGRREALEVAAQDNFWAARHGSGACGDTRRWRGWAASWALLSLGPGYVGDSRR